MGMLSKSLRFFVYKIGTIILTISHSWYEDWDNMYEGPVTKQQGTPPSCPCSLLRMTHLTVDAEITCLLPRILFTQTPSCRVENSSCLMRRHDNNRKPCPTLLSSLTSNPRSRFLIIVLNYIYCHICLSNFLAWYVQCTKTPGSCCSFISQVVSHWI